MAGSSEGINSLHIEKVSVLARLGLSQAFIRPWSGHQLPPGAVAQWKSQGRARLR